MKRASSIALTALLLAACQTVPPEKLAGKTRIVAPAGARGAPVVVFYQGTGGGDKRALAWAEWFQQRGVASLIVDNAGVRGMGGFSGTNVDYSADAFAALRLAKNDPRLDTRRYALMGFSRGGTQAMQADWSRDKETPPPGMVFAFYPGNEGVCANSFGTATAVHVFYGDLDDWGNHQGTRDACARETGVSFHLLKGAHHGFDDAAGSTWSAAGQTFRSAPNSRALNEARAIIDTQLRTAWGARE
jgi:dienelactone hydrolase